MKKIISLLLVLVMILGLVVCVNADGNARPFEGRTLTIAHGHHAYADAYNAQFAAFEEKYGCTIEVEMLSENADEQESLMLTRAATGTLPDVFPSNVGAKLQEFDPDLYNLLSEYFPKTNLQISKHKKVNEYGKY